MNDDGFVEFDFLFSKRTATIICMGRLLSNIPTCWHPQCQFVFSHIVHCARKGKVFDIQH